MYHFMIIHFTFYFLVLKLIKKLFQRLTLVINNKY